MVKDKNRKAHCVICNEANTINKRDKLWLCYKCHNLNDDRG